MSEQKPEGCEDEQKDGKVDGSPHHIVVTLKFRSEERSSQKGGPCLPQMLCQVNSDFPPTSSGTCFLLIGPEQELSATRLGLVIKAFAL